MPGRGKKTKTAEAANELRSESLGAAFYSDKEKWKKEPGNRYTPEELREMERNWKVEVKNPHVPYSRRVD